MIVLFPSWASFCLAPSQILPWKERQALQSSLFFLSFRIFLPTLQRRLQPCSSAVRVGVLVYIFNLILFKFKGIRLNVISEVSNIKGNFFHDNLIANSFHCFLHSNFTSVLHRKRFVKVQCSSFYFVLQQVRKPCK